MKHSLLVAGFLVGLASLATAGTAHADKLPIHSSGRMGIGLGSGTIANGLSFKYYPGPSTAFQLNVGSFGGGGASDRYGDFKGLAASLDFLLEQPSLVKTDLFTLDWSYGIGGGIGARDDVTGIAVAGVVGLELNFLVVPVDLVLEYRPTLAVSPDVDFEPVDFTAQVRIYFK